MDPRLGKKYLIDLDEKLHKVNVKDEKPKESKELSDTFKWALFPILSVSADHDANVNVYIRDHLRKDGTSRLSLSLSNAQNQNRLKASLQLSVVHQHYERLVCSLFGSARSDVDEQNDTV